MKPHSPNYTFITLFAILLAFGLVMMASASQVIGSDTFNDSYYYLKHQMFYGVLPGFIVLLITSHINYEFLKKLAMLLFVVSFMLLILVFIPQLGFTHGGARRWLYFGSISLQPAELIKLTSILFFSSWLIKKKEQLRDFYYGFIPFILIFGLILSLIALQPDIGTLSVIAASIMSVYFIAGSPKKYIFLLFITGLLAFGILIKIAPYRIARLTAYLDPKSDALDTSYQINQSLIAVGAGGAFGRGFGQSKQKYQYLPEVIGDSIFAVIAEELGFILTSIFILIYIYFIILGFNIANKAPTSFGKYIVVGIMSWIAMQTFINIGAMLKVFPLTGLPLPFVSYGSSALITSMAAVGIIINVSKFTPH